MLRIFLLNILCFEFCLKLVTGISENGVVTGEWDGVNIYISVKRERIQNQLNAFHNSRSDRCSDGPRLYMRDDHILPHLRHSDRYPVYISFGHIKTHDFDEHLRQNPNTCVSVSGLEVAVSIPFLAGVPGGPPFYALALAKFYERSRGDIPKINLLYPYIPVDEIKMNDFEAVVRNGSDEIRVSFNRLNETCKAPTSIVKEEFEAFIHSDFQFGLPQPDYSFCDRHLFESKFCENAERIKCGVHRNSPNICQQWSSKTTKQCVTMVEMKNLTLGFRKHFLLDDDVIDILASETDRNNFTVLLKYPCQEW